MSAPLRMVLAQFIQLLLLASVTLSWVMAEEYPAASGASTFYAEGKQFLQGQVRVKMCIDPDWEPYEKLDDKNQHAGIIARYFSILEKRSGLDIEVLSTESWAQSMEFIKQRKCDIISALSDSHDRGVYLSFTAPFIREPSVLVTREGNQTITQLSDMAGKTTAVVKGYIYDTNLQLDYPDIELVYVDNIQDGLRRVASGKIDAIIGRRFAMRYWIQKLQLDLLTTRELIQYQSLLRIGVRNDYGELYLILNRAIKSLNNQDHARIRHNDY